MEELLRDNGGKTLPIIFDLVTNNAMSPKKKYFPRCIGNTVKLEISPFYPTWDDIPKKEKVKLVIQAVEIIMIRKSNRRDLTILSKTIYFIYIVLLIQFLRIK